LKGNNSATVGSNGSERGHPHADQELVAQHTVRAANHEEKLVKQVTIATTNGP
jgi:hypothetical protein